MKQKTITTRIPMKCIILKALKVNSISTAFLSSLKSHTVYILLPISEIVEILNRTYKILDIQTEGELQYPPLEVKATSLSTLIYVSLFSKQTLVLLSIRLYLFTFTLHISFVSWNLLDCLIIYLRWFFLLSDVVNKVFLNTGMSLSPALLYAYYYPLKIYKSAKIANLILFTYEAYMIFFFVASKTILVKCTKKIFLLS